MPFDRGREMLDPSDFRQFLHPNTLNLEEIADSPPDYEILNMNPYPSNPRMRLSRLYLQMGVFLDYYTGLHCPSLSSRLRQILKAEGNVDLPSVPFTSTNRESYLALFPQYSITSEFPPTFLIHGEYDSAVLLRESQNLRDLLEAANVKNRLVVVKGEEHSFDFRVAAYTPGLDALLADLSEQIFAFISEHTS